MSELEGWTREALGMLGEWGGGGTPSKEQASFWKDGSIPWVSPKDMKVARIRDSEDHITEAAVDGSAAKVFKPGAVLVVTRSGILEHSLPVAVTDAPVTVNQDLKALVPFDGVSSDFIAWAIRTFSTDILKRCKKDGTTVASVEFDALKRYQMPIAPREEQSRIVDAIDSYLSRLDAAVTSLERVQAKLKAYRASVLKAAVEGRLVPTEAELARQEGREYEPAQVLLDRILRERRRRWEEAELERLKKAGKTPKDDSWKAKYEEPKGPDTSELPALPEGWCWARAEQVSEFITKGTTPSKEQMTTKAGDVPYVKVYNLTFEGALNFSLDPTYVPRAVHEGFLERSICFPGDVLMNIVGPPLGKVSIVPPLFREWNINQAIARYRPIEISPRYLANVLLGEQALRWATQRSKATVGQFNLTLEISRDIPIPLPPCLEQVRIADEIDRTLSAASVATATVVANLKRTVRLRQSVLKWAFEGKLVDQDPNDEPAEKLLERIRAEQAAAAPEKKPRGRKPKAP